MAAIGWPDAFALVGLSIGGALAMWAFAWMSVKEEQEVTKRAKDLYRD